MIICYQESATLEKSVEELFPSYDDFDDISLEGTSHESQRSDVANLDSKSVRASMYSNQNLLA